MSTPEKADSGAVKPLRILVADDNAPFRTMISEYLAIDGHSVEAAESGAEAWTLFGTGEHDLVITDQTMPGMTGEQLAARIKEVSPETPVVLLSGLGEYLESQPPAVDLVLEKPVSLVAVREAIRIVRRA